MTAELRAAFARHVALLGEAADPRIEAAFAATPRERFAGPGPWSIVLPGSGYVLSADVDPARLYHDNLIALDALAGINIGQPSLHARCFAALAVQPGESVVHVGAGSGYYTAMLARLTGPEGRVDAYEIRPDLAARAAENLADLPWVRVHAGSGAVDRLQAADVVYVSAGLAEPYPAWLDALRPGGRLLFPLQSAERWGAMLLVRRPSNGTAWPARFVCAAGFIPCQAVADGDAGRGLAAAFADGGWPLVRSLRRGGTPDATCWFGGRGWWLSTAAADES